MIIRQRQIVEVAFRLPPDGEILNHPCIVLSNEEINAEEEGFVAVMMTSSRRYEDDLYSFEITDAMLTKPHKKPFCAARIHLIGNFIYDDVIINSNWANEIRIEHFENLLTQINRITFNARI